MEALPYAVPVAKDLLFDPRLALYHREERWLAVADLHYGYELSFQRAGALFPQFGMADIEERLAALVADYQPQTLLLLGDHIHNGAAARPFLHWLDALRERLPAIVLLQGNHDRALLRTGLDLPRCFRSGKFHFSHGHETADMVAGERVIGHWHPGVTMQDASGFRQKLPALARKGSCWIMPAFSVWAAGGQLGNCDETEYWVSTGSKCYHRKSLA